MDAVGSVEPVYEDRVIDGVKCSTEVEGDQDRGGILINGVEDADICNISVNISADLCVLHLDILN